VTGTLPTDVAIEQADSDDAERLADIWVDLAVDQREHRSNLEPEDNRNRIREAMLQHVVTGTAIVARCEGSIVGFVTFGRETEHYEQDIHRGVIHNIYVTDGNRGSGIGGRLLARAEAELSEMGVDAIALQAMAANESARRFYRRHGYRPHRIEFQRRVESDTLTTDDS
jgi:ribosomal protein S18 acetylase RimI-like enzyme